MSVGSLFGRLRASGEERSVLDGVDELLLGCEEEKLLAVSTAALWMRDVHVLSQLVALTLDCEMSAAKWSCIV